MISGDLLPSYVLQALGACFVFIAIFLTDDSGYLTIEAEKRLMLALAFICSSGAWYIAIRQANKWLRLWRGKHNV